MTSQLALVPVARIPHLVAMKVLARDDRRRPRDLDDLHSLIDSATPDEIQHARELLAMIESRGAGRGRALVEAYELLLTERRAGPWR